MYDIEDTGNGKDGETDRQYPYCTVFWYLAPVMDVKYQKTQSQNDILGNLKFIISRFHIWIRVNYDFIGINIHLFSRMLLHRRKDLAPKQTVFQKSACQHRFFSLKRCFIGVMLFITDVGKIWMPRHASIFDMVSRERFSCPLGTVETYCRLFFILHFALSLHLDGVADWYALSLEIVADGASSKVILKLRTYDWTDAPQFKWFIHFVIVQSPLRCSK